MTDRNRFSFGNSRITRRWLGLAVLAVALFVMLPAATSDADFSLPSLDAQDQVEDLIVCYANGTDTLGSAVNAVGGQPLDSTVNMNDPQFVKGLEFYRRCFTDDFSFMLARGGTVLLTVPDPNNPLPHASPALQWANFVNNAFRGPQYINTQHHMGSIRSHVRGNRATANSYLIATHSYGPNSPISPITGLRRTGVNVVGGNYTDDDVRIRGKWYIRKRLLDITSGVQTPANLQ